MDDNLKDRVHSLEQRLIQKGRETIPAEEMSLSSHMTFVLPVVPQTVKRDAAEFVMTRGYESFNRIFGKDMVLSIGIPSFPKTAIMRRL